jgi:hypothetical protein
MLSRFETQPADRTGAPLSGALLSLAGVEKIQRRAPPSQFASVTPEPAGDTTNVHALYFGEVREQRHSATSHRYTIQARQEETDIRPEDRVQRQTMPLLRRILHRKYLIEFADQSVHIGCPLGTNSTVILSVLLTSSPSRPIGRSSLQVARFCN